MHVGGNTVEINTEAPGGDIIEYRPPDDKPSAGMFEFSCTFLCVFLWCAFRLSFHTYAICGKLLFVVTVIFLII